MASACALAIISGKNIYNFAILENLRIFQNCLFTEGVVVANGICSAAFCESAALRLASSPSPSSLRDATSPKGRGSGETTNSALEPETIPLCQGLSPWESWQARQGLTERARMLPGN